MDFFAGRVIGRRDRKTGLEIGDEIGQNQPIQFQSKKNPISISFEKSRGFNVFSLIPVEGVGNANS